MTHLKLMKMVLQYFIIRSLVAVRPKLLLMNTIARVTVFSLLFVPFITSSCRKNEVPTLWTSEITNITIASATSGGIVTDKGSGTIVERGICWSKDIIPTVANSKTNVGGGAGSFICNISHLNEGTTYNVRAYATNIAGTGYGNTLSFTTLGQVPTAVTEAANNVTTTSATLNGEINANYLSTNVTFDYGTTTNYGNSVEIPNNPLQGNVFTSISANVSGLLPGTIYHFRLKAVNSLGTTYGGDMSFAPNMIDINYNIYNVIIIGSQAWFGENLRVTSCNDDNAISNITDGTAWGTLTTPAYCWYNNDPIYESEYGALYNWYAVNTGKLCPVGWHVPTYADWSTLRTYLGGQLVTGGKLKEAGTVHWKSPNTGATNETGFTALPGGDRRGGFIEMGQRGYWWLATEYSTITAWGTSIIYYEPVVFEIDSNDKKCGLSVRCIRDQ
jgi:uncharacterized protein (TIGR02145 family)